MAKGKGRKQVINNFLMTIYVIELQSLAKQSYHIVLLVLLIFTYITPTISYLRVHPYNFFQLHVCSSSVVRVWLTHESFMRAVMYRGDLVRVLKMIKWIPKQTAPQ